MFCHPNKKHISECALPSKHQADCGVYNKHTLLWILNTMWLQKEMSQGVTESLYGSLPYTFQGHIGKLSPFENLSIKLNFKTHKHVSIKLLQNLQLKIFVTLKCIQIWWAPFVYFIVSQILTFLIWTGVLFPKNESLNFKGF